MLQISTQMCALRAPFKAQIDVELGVIFGSAFGRSLRC